jgi:hypothetical protein
LNKAQNARGHREGCKKLLFVLGGSSEVELLGVVMETGWQRPATRRELWSPNCPWEPAVGSSAAGPFCPICARHWVWAWDLWPGPGEMWDVCPGEAGLAWSPHRSRHSRLGAGFSRPPKCRGPSPQRKVEGWEHLYVLILTLNNLLHKGSNLGQMNGSKGTI